MPDLKGELQRKLQASRAALVSKLDDLNEYDRRRPMTPSGTNLLGLVKHLAGLEYAYLGESLGHPYKVRRATASSRIGDCPTLVTDKKPPRQRPNRG